ncbi:hypothetical protein D3C86_1772370 [compost metagenome]
MVLDVRGHHERRDAFDRAVDVLDALKNSRLVLARTQGVVRALLRAVDVRQRLARRGEDRLGDRQNGRDEQVRRPGRQRRAWALQDHVVIAACSEDRLEVVAYLGFRRRLPLEDLQRLLGRRAIVVEQPLR